MNKISTIQNLTEEFQTKLTALSQHLENPTPDEQKEFKKSVREFMKTFVPKMEKEIMESSIVEEDEDISSSGIYTKKELDAMKITELRKIAKDTFKLTISARTKKSEYVEQILQKQSSMSKKSQSPKNSPKNSPKTKYKEEVEEEHPYEVIQLNEFLVDKETKKYVFDPNTKTVVGLLEKGKVKPLRKIDVKALEKKKIRMYHTHIAKRESVLKADEIEEILKGKEEEEIIIIDESEKSDSSKEEEILLPSSIHLSDEDLVVEEEDDGSEDGKEIYLPENAVEEKDITETFRNSLKDILQKEPKDKDISVKKQESPSKVIPNLKKSPPKSTSATPKASITITKEDYIAFRERKNLSKMVLAEILRNNDKYKKQFGFEDD